MECLRVGFPFATDDLSPFGWHKLRMTSIVIILCLMLCRLTRGRLQAACLAILERPRSHSGCGPAADFVEQESLPAGQLEVAVVNIARLI